MMRTIICYKSFTIILYNLVFFPKQVVLWRKVELELELELELEDTEQLEYIIIHSLLKTQCKKVYSNVPKLSTTTNHSCASTTT